MSLVGRVISKLGLVVFFYGLVSFIASMFGSDIIPFVWEYQNDSLTWLAKCLVTGIGMFLLMMGAFIKGNVVKNGK